MKITKAHQSLLCKIAGSGAKGGRVMTYEKAVSIMSGNFLTEEIPSNWQNMEYDDLDKFILDHVSAPYENWDIEDIWTLIEQVGSAAFGLRDLGAKQ